jgi:proline dehydrogenase
MGLVRTVLLQASKNQWMRERLPQFSFAQRAVRRFMPGEDADSALQAAKYLQPERISSIVSYLGENVKDVNETRQVARQYCDVLKKVKAAAIDCEISVKPTQVGHDISTDLSFENLQKILETASELGNYVWIDMEESDYVDSTLDLYRRLKKTYGNTGVCLQSYLYRTAEDLKTLLSLRPGIRLVKGAYREPPDRAFPKKRDVDRNFLELSGTLLDAVERGHARAGFATHDEKILSKVVDLAQRRGIRDGSYEIQMLYGIRNAALRRFVRSGQHGRILISYGPAWYPWYMRRLAERPANILFVLRNVFG